jgi:outer membrane protein assembly factor BamE (lipoprotein component of BamABCDE complex)
MKAFCSPPTASFRVLATATLLLSAGCSTAPVHRAGVRDETVHRLTLGTVQKDLRVGMTSADVLAVLGPPNIVATDDQRREVWTYDKVATESVSSSGSFNLFPLIFGGSGGAAGSASHTAGATSQTQRTLTVSVKFDAERRVRDFAYHASAF